MVLYPHQYALYLHMHCSSSESVVIYMYDGIDTLTDL